MRPALPEGPYLVVGLARSGAAAARMLLAHGRGPVFAADRASPAVPAGVDAHLESDGLELLDRAALVVKSPGVPADAPAIAAARERGLPVLGELELAWRLLPNPFVAVTGTNGKTTTTELLGAIWRAAELPGGGGRQRGHPAVVPGGHHPPELDGGVRGLELPGRGLRGLRPRHGAAAEPRGGPSGSPRHARRLPRGQAEGVRKPDRRPGGRCPRRVRAAGPRPAGSVRRPGRAATGSRGDPAARSAQPGERHGRLRGCHRVGRARRGGGGRVARLRRRAAPARGGRLGGRRALRERLEGHQRRVGAPRARVVRGGRSRHSRGQPQGRRLRRPARGGGALTAAPAT